MNKNNTSTLEGYFYIDFYGERYPIIIKVSGKYYKTCDLLKRIGLNQFNKLFYNSLEFIKDTRYPSIKISMNRPVPSKPYIKNDSEIILKELMETLQMLYSEGYKPPQPNPNNIQDVKANTNHNLPTNTQEKSDYNDNDFLKLNILSVESNEIINSKNELVKIEYINPIVKHKKDNEEHNIFQSKLITLGVISKEEIQYFKDKYNN